MLRPVGGEQGDVPRRRRPLVVPVHQCPETASDLVTQLRIGEGVDPAGPPRQLVPPLRGELLDRGAADRGVRRVGDGERPCAAVQQLLDLPDIALIRDRRLGIDQVQLQHPHRPPVGGRSGQSDERLVSRSALAAAPVRVRTMRELEIDEAGPGPVPHDDVLGMDVAEQPPRIVHGLQGLVQACDGRGEPRAVGLVGKVPGSRSQHRGAGHPFALEIVPLEMLHDEEPVLPGGERPVVGGNALEPLQLLEHFGLVHQAGRRIGAVDVQSCMRARLLHDDARALRHELVRRGLGEVDAAAVGEVERGAHREGEVDVLLVRGARHRLRERRPVRRGVRGSTRVLDLVALGVDQGRHEACVVRGRDEGAVSEEDRPCSPAPVGEDVRTVASRQEGVESLESGGELLVGARIDGDELPGCGTVRVLAVLLQEIAR